jgi:prevent-host-death family protein
MKTVTASDANRQFSAILRKVAQGHSIVITSRGKAVATMSPMTQTQDKKRQLAKTQLLKRLKKQPVSGQVRTWTRDGLYD